MTTVYLSPIGNDAPFYNGGLQLSGGKLYTYAAGTTTLQTTYSENPGTVPNQNANPVVLNSEGYPASGGNRVAIWLNRESYKFVMKTSADVTLWTLDNIDGINNFHDDSAEWIDTDDGVLPTYVSATSFTLAGDHTDDARKERWVKTTNSGGTAYSVVLSSTYVAPTTTIVVANASGTMDSGISLAQWGLLRPDHPSIPFTATSVKGTDVASAATTDIWATNGNVLHITGSTTITSFGTPPYAGDRRRLVFDSALTITHNSSTLVCPGAFNLTVAANDMVDIVADSTSKVYVFAAVGASTGLPTGSITDYAGGTAPTGWLECDGSAVSRTTYAALFTALSTTWGAGDTTTTFNLPDFRGRVRTGKGTGTITETVTSQLAAANAIPVTSNATKWITGQPTVLSGVTGFVGVTNGTYYVVRVDATHVSFSTTLANAQVGVVATLTGTGSMVMTSALTARTLGTNGGQETHAISSTETLAHAHTIDEIVLIDGGGIYGTSNTGANFVHITTNNYGGNVAMNIMPPFAVTMVIIKT